MFSGGAVLTAVDIKQEAVARRLDVRYGQPLPGPPPEGGESLEDPGQAGAAFPYRRHIEHLKGDLGEARDALASAEDGHQRALALIDELLGLRGQLNDALSGRFFQVRHTVESLFGARRGFVLANVSGTTPQSPARLAEQAEQTVKFLRDPAVEPPSHGLNGARVDLAELANDLETPLKELKAVLTALARARKEAESTLAVKQEAIAGFDEIFRWVSRALESLFHLAGLHAEAERIRPSVRRPGRRAVDEEAAPGSPTGRETAPRESPDGSPGGGSPDGGAPDGPAAASPGAPPAGA